MDQLRAMRVFARVVDEGGFAAAARALDLAPAVVTRVMAELEDHLGARLLNRTTRRMALTEAGADYLASVRRILDEVDAANAAATDASGVPSGHLRVRLPPALAVHVLAARLPDFHARYPQISIELHSPGPVEDLDEAHDLTLLSVRGALEGDFVARRLARTEVILCASPGYLDRRGRPREPEDLVGYDAMMPPMGVLQRGVTFVHGQGRAVTLVPGRPVLATTHTDTMVAAAQHGLGIAALPSFIVAGKLLDGTLERVLPDWRLFSLTLWAAMPTRKHLPARTRVFLDFLIDVFGGEDRDPWLAAAGCETCGEAAQRSE